MDFELCFHTCLEDEDEHQATNSFQDEDKYETQTHRFGEHDIAITALKSTTDGPLGSVIWPSVSSFLSLSLIDSSFPMLLRSLLLNSHFPSTRVSFSVTIS